MIYYYTSVVINHDIQWGHVQKLYIIVPKHKSDYRVLVIDEVMCGIIVAEHKNDLCLCYTHLTCSNEISYGTDQVL